MLYVLAAFVLVFGIGLGSVVHPVAGIALIVLAALLVALAVVRAQRGQAQWRSASRRRAGRDSAWGAGFLVEGGGNQGHGHGHHHDGGGSSDGGGGSSCGGGGCGGGGGS
ncbi:hypothetical protein [Nocardia jiangsuensis]|uniref:TIGR04222 domain-containing membrane protein n=1 Tax=Nocardia jiangsuensis TaxID=1691563 RepID=A0ABV8DLA8_9NOCA